MTLFIYEYVSAQGANRDGTSRFAPSLSAEGNAMREAVVEDFGRVPNLEVRTLTETDSKEAFQFHAARCDRSLVVAPEFDGILETRCRWVLEAGGRLLGPAPEAVQLTADKFALFDHFRTHGVAAPMTWHFADRPDRYPQVWKPRYGAGSQSTFRVRDGDDAERARAILQSEGVDTASLIAQPLYGGMPASVAFLIGPRERTALLPCSQVLSEDGRFQYLGGVCPIEADRARRAVAVADAALRIVPGLSGYVGVDLLLGATESEDVVIEVNPRLTTSYVGLRQLADFNLAEAMWSIAQGNTAPIPTWNDARVRFRADGEFRIESNVVR